jgi:hypothetical protein
MSSEKSGILKNSRSFASAGSGEDPADFSGNFGENNYQKKAEMLDKEIENRIGLDDLLEVGTYFRKFVTQDIPKTANSTYKTVKSGLTPGFIKRMRRKKIHLKYAEEREEYDTSVVYIFLFLSYIFFVGK